MIKDMIKKTRTYRRFYENVQVTEKDLHELIELARLSGSGANLQSLRYIVSKDDNKNNRIFKHLKWAGYLKDWNGPEEGERPSAYIVMVHDTSISKGYFWDHGIAAQSIMLGATEKNLGGCMFGAINKKGLKEDLNIDDRYDVVMVIALGKPKEIVVLDEVRDNDIKYWRDEDGVHHVPKRGLDDLIIK